MDETLPSSRFRLLTCSMKLSDVKIPFLLLFISLVQITIYYGKTLPLFYVQTDSLRRFEIWRLVTSSLAHRQMTGNIPDEHLWSNMIGQLLYGWKLEGRLGSRYTLLLYITSAISGGLIWSARQACQGSGIGASTAVSGLAAAHLSKYVLTGQWFPGWFCLSVYATIGLEVSAAVFQVFEVIVPKKYSATAHLGGALGGFILGVCLWNKVLPTLSVQSQRRIKVVKFVSAFALVFYLVVGARYSYYAYILSPNTAIRQNFRDALLEQGPFVYNRFSFRLCKIYWRSYTQGNQTAFILLRDIVPLDNSSYLDYTQDLMRS